MVHRGTIGHGRCDTSVSLAAVTAGSCAGFDVLMGKLEVLLLFSRSEFTVLRPGVVLGLDVSAAVDLNLRGNSVQPSLRLSGYIISVMIHCNVTTSRQCLCYLLLVVYCRISGKRLCCCK